MAIFTQSPSNKRETAPLAPETALKKEPDTHNEFSFNPGAATAAATPAFAPATTPTPALSPSPPSRAIEREVKESLIASDLSIEGKIQGAGHIRIAGRFKGDVQVDGDLTIEVGAKVNGSVRARKVTIAGELEGNVESASRVELLDGAMMVGDIKSGVVTVAPGSRMRGQVEFGWDDAESAKPASKVERAKPESGNDA